MISSSLFSNFLLLLAASSAVAQSTACTPQNAFPIENLPKAGSGSNSGSSSSLPFPVDNTIFASELGSTYGAADLNRNPYGSKLAKRTLSCRTGDYCFSANKVPVCINPKNGDFYSEIDSGNIVSGAFTLANGSTGNLYSTRAPSGTATGRVAGASVTSSATSRAASTSGVAAPTQSSTTGDAPVVKVGLSAVFGVLVLGAMVN